MVHNQTTRRAPACPIRLDQPPGVVFASAGTHGLQARRETYVLPDLWAIHLYLGAARFTVLDHEHLLRPGDVSMTPQGQTSTYHWLGRCDLLCAHFKIPRLAAGRDSVLQIVTPANDRLGDWRDRMEAIIAAGTTHKASALLWALLWDLHDRAARKGHATDPILNQAEQWIELHLNQPIRIRDLAREVGVSHTYLGRLFRIHHQSTIVAYLRARRAARARHLLEHTTQPAKMIAAQVGLNDLQRLNKLLRHAYGHGPRWFR